MAKQTSLYSGYVKGKATAINLGPNNPQIDMSIAQKDASAKFRAEKTIGVIAHQKVDGPARRIASQPGRRVNGAIRTNGGTF